VQFRNNFYEISDQEEKVRLYKGGKVEIRQLLNGDILALFAGKLVKMTLLSEIESPILDEKQILFWKEKYVPLKTHPYKQMYNKWSKERVRDVI
jgi:hypothetical protein